MIGKRKIGGLFFLAGIMMINTSNAQETSSGDFEIEKNTISLNVLGTASYLGVSYERLIYERLNLEVGVGLIGYGAGVTIYPLRKAEINKLSPFVGIKYTKHGMVDVGARSITYIPFGLSFFSKRMINISGDLGPGFFYYKTAPGGPQFTKEEKAKYPFSYYNIFGNLKFSFRF